MEIIKEKTLNNIVKGVQFKGVTNKEFCDYIITYFLERFTKPLVFEPKTNLLFDAEIKKWGKENLNEFILHVKNNIIPGVYSIQTSDKERKFATKLNSDMIDYLVCELNKIN